MILKISEGSKVAYVDNTDREIGNIDIYGEESLVNQLDLMLNKDIVLTFSGMAKRTPDEIKVKVGKRTYINTVSDLYLKKYFPKNVEALGYEVEIEEE